MKTQIGATNYELLLMPQSQLSELLSEDMSDALAYINNVDCVICVSNDMPIQTMQQSFFHEVVHGMLEEIGERDLNSDEGFVEAMAKQLYSFYTRNNTEKILNHIADKHDVKNYKKISTRSTT